MSDRLACSTHCCKNHGCKYGYADCPVETGVEPQQYLCEYCTWALQEEEVFEFNMVGSKILFGYRRKDGSIEALPDDAEVLARVSEALLGLEVGPGWTIQLVRE